MGYYAITQYPNSAEEPVSASKLRGIVSIGNAERFEGKASVAGVDATKIRGSKTSMMSVDVSSEMQGGSTQRGCSGDAAENTKPRSVLYQSEAHHLDILASRNENLCSNSIVLEQCGKKQ